MFQRCPRIATVTKPRANQGLHRKVILEGSQSSIASAKQAGDARRAWFWMVAPRHVKLACHI